MDDPTPIAVQTPMKYTLQPPAAQEKIYGQVHTTPSGVKFWRCECGERRDHGPQVEFCGSCQCKRPVQWIDKESTAIGKLQGTSAEVCKSKIAHDLVKVQPMDDGPVGLIFYHDMVNGPIRNTPKQTQPRPYLGGLSREERDHAFGLGEADAQAGLPSTSIPYPRDTEIALQWVKGWTSVTFFNEGEPKPIVTSQLKFQRCAPPGPNSTQEMMVPFKEQSGGEQDSTGR